MTIIDTSKEEQERESNKLLSKVNDFLEYTTAHGFGRLAASKGTIWKVFWIAFVLAAHSMFWYQSIVIVKDYLNKPIRTKISVKHAQKQNFPMITICNRNSLRKSKITPDIEEKIEEAFKSIKKKQKSSSNTTDRFDGALPSPEAVHSSRARLDALRKILFDIRYDDLVEMGHALEEMIVDCSFNSQDCSDFNNKMLWRHMWIDEVGNCYSFNPTTIKDKKGTDRAALQAVLSGDQHGLTLIMNAQQDKYLHKVSPYAGFRIIVGLQNEMPFPLNEGISVAPGRATSIEIRKNHVLRIDPFENGTCESSNELAKDNHFRVDYNMSYSKMACTSSCLINLQSDRCKCSQHEYDIDHEFCDFGNNTVVSCLKAAYDEFLDGPCERQCPPPCSEEFFTTTISSSKWPSNNYKDNLIESLENEFEIEMNATQISENLLELRVYFAELDYLRVEETLKYGFEDLMSNIGGQMGVWIGLSALTICEVFEMICILIRCLLNKKKEKNSVINVDSM